MLPEEAKHQSLHIIKQALAEDEEYSKETIEGRRLEAVENITKYQEQTKKWRDSVTPSVLHHKSFTKTCHEHHVYVLMHVIKCVDQFL